MTTDNKVEKCVLIVINNDRDRKKRIMSTITITHTQNDFRMAT